MAGGGGDIVAIAGIVAAQRSIGALNDTLGAFNDAIEWRAKHFIEGVIEGHAARSCRHGHCAVGLHRAAETGEATFGASDNFTAEDHFPTVVCAAARVL